MADPSKGDDGLEAAQASDALAEQLTHLAHDIIDAGFDVLVAWCWIQDNGTIAKRPAFYNGHLDAHHDKQLIAEQIELPPHRPTGTPDTAHAVIAFIPGTGGCGVLDFDVKNGKHGAETYRNLSTGHHWSPTAAWNTPSGGANVLFTKPPGAVYSNRSPWPAVDVRADNGWVVAPGNLHVGAGWRWNLGGFTTATPLPDTMASLLSPSTEHGRPASNTETIRFMDASRQTSTLAAQTTFTDQLLLLRQSATGSRHDAMRKVLAFAFGMEHLDLHWASERIKAEWTALMESTNEVGRECEVDDLATWLVGQEIANNAPNAVRAGLATAPKPDIQMSGFRDIPNPFVLPTLTWHAEDLLCRDTHGELAGAEKTLKSYIGLIIDVGLAAGKDIFGQFPVAERQRVSLLIGEGGEEPFLRRVREICSAYGIQPGDLQGWLHYTTDRITVDSPLFLELVRTELDTFGPALVHADPWYTYQPARVESSQLTSVAAALESYTHLCREAGASALINHHFNRTDQHGLRKITGAGHAEWVDSWLLTSHRDQPDVANGKYRLTLEVGSRRWGGGTWDLDLTINVPLGQLRWKIGPSSVQPTTTHDPFIAIKVDLLRIGHAARKPLTRQEWAVRCGKRRDATLAAFDELVDDGMIVTAGTAPAGKGHTTATYVVQP
jgi:hypothetical protein